jgi:hypothetical protein
MSASADTSTSRWAGFVSSLWTQACAALSIGLPSEDETGPDCEQTACDSALPAHRAVRSMDDYSGYLTSNGLGSLDIGGRATRSGE